MHRRAALIAAFRRRDTRRNVGDGCRLLHRLAFAGGWPRNVMEPLPPFSLDICGCVLQSGAKAPASGRPSAAPVSPVLRGFRWLHGRSMPTLPFFNMREC